MFVLHNVNMICKTKEILDYVLGGALCQLRGRLMKPAFYPLSEVTISFLRYAPTSTHAASLEICFAFFKCARLPAAKRIGQEKRNRRAIRQFISDPNYALIIYGFRLFFFFKFFIVCFI